MDEKPSAKNVGKIVLENGKYFLEVGKAQKFPLGPVVEQTIPKEMVGKNVELIMTDPKPYVVGAKIDAKEFKCYFILCYLPRDVFGRIDERVVIPLVDKEVRISIANKLRNEKVIKAEEYERMVNL